MMISQLQYARSHGLTAWVKPLTIFLKAKHVGSKAIDLLHQLGICMSNGWAVHAYKKISEERMKEVRQVARRYGHRKSIFRMRAAYPTSGNPQTLD